MRHPTRCLLGLLMVATAVFVLVAGCSDTGQDVLAPAEPELLSESNPAVQKVMAVQNLHTPDIMKDPEVVGTATGLDEGGKPAILVLLKSDAGGKKVGKEIDGIPVVRMVTGPIKALKSTGISHKTRQPRPIQLGVSGGNAYDLANNYCCSGTLGALVVSGNTQYILSNSHVLCQDIASSPGDPDIAQIGDPIDQPGLIDVYCQDIENDYVGYLSTLTSLLSGSNVDCAMAEVIQGMVRTDGSILEIGTISSQTMDAYVNLDVKKSGRTTGLTRSYVTGINATVNVGYTDECNGSAFTVLYTGQILIKNRASKFLGGGDSGSLMVEDVDENPRAVGLLYAGSSQIAVANPIDDVLSYLDVSLVGN